MHGPGWGIGIYILYVPTVGCFFFFFPQLFTLEKGGDYVAMCVKWDDL